MTLSLPLATSLNRSKQLSRQNSDLRRFNHFCTKRRWQTLQQSLLLLNIEKWPELFVSKAPLTLFCLKSEINALCTAVHKTCFFFLPTLLMHMFICICACTLYILVFVHISPVLTLTEEERRLLRVSMHPEGVILDFIYSCVLMPWKFSAKGDTSPFGRLQWMFHKTFYNKIFYIQDLIWICQLTECITFHTRCA